MESGVLVFNNKVASLLGCPYHFYRITFFQYNLATIICDGTRKEAKFSGETSAQQSQERPQEEKYKKRQRIRFKLVL